MRMLADANALTMGIILKQQPEVVQALKEAASKLDSVYHLDYADSIDKNTKEGAAEYQAVSEDKGQRPGDG